MKKTCSRCRMEKDTSEFARHRAYKDGFYCWCRECSRTYTRENQRRPKFRARIKEKNQQPEAKARRQQATDRYYQRNPNKRKAIDRNGHLFKTYGITQEEYNELLLKQEGRCACCGKVPEKILNVDHDHETGEIRGLLCPRCNVAIGMLDDTLEGVQRAVAYLSPKKVTYEPLTFIA